MTWWARLRTLARDALGRGRMEREMDAELRHHVASYTDDLVRQGIPREQAERQARIEFGQLEPLKEECRQARGLRLLDETSQDLRYAVRMLRKSPGFTAIAVLTLALGIGVNTAIFSVVNAWILKSLPYRNPDQLVTIREVDPRNAAVGVVAPADASDWRKDHEVFEEICAYTTPIFTLLHGEEPEQLYGARINSEFFHMLGVTPHLGRGFLPQEDTPDAAPVAIISHELWQSRYQSDVTLVGKTIPIDGQKVTVVRHSPGRLPSATSRQGRDLYAAGLDGGGAIQSARALSQRDRAHASRHESSAGRRIPADRSAPPPKRLSGDQRKPKHSTSHLAG